MTQEQIDKINRLRAAYRAADIAEHEAKVALNSYATELRAICDHEQADGSSAMDDVDPWYQCRICGEML